LKQIDFKGASGIINFWLEAVWVD